MSEASEYDEHGIIIAGRDDEIEELRATVSRLRGALEEIAKSDNEDMRSVLPEYRTPYALICCNVAAIARAALKETA